MGCCESILRAAIGKGTSDADKITIELEDTSKPFTLHSALRGAQVSIENEHVSGTGLALGCAPVEQDSAYWETTITALPPGGIISVGVARHLAGENASLMNEPSLGDGDKTWGICTANGGAAGSIKEGDVVGIALDFTDLPMLFFTVNGSPLGSGDESSTMRIRGTVYPAVGVGSGSAARVAFSANSLRHRPPRKCQALVVGQDMI